MLKIKSWPKLIMSIFLAQSAGAVGTIFTVSSIPTWYALLNKPSFSPPNWVFAPVWTILYTLIGISLYIIWTKSKKGVPTIFWLHLLLNAVWSPIFFGLKNLGLAFFVIVLMVMSLVIVIKRFKAIDKIAGYLLIPYLLWISFATILNLSIWRLNPQNIVKDIFAQDFNFTKAKTDYVFMEDTYKAKLTTFNLKKDSYQKNPTLSLKEEARVALLDFLGARNDLVKSYLTMLRLKALESEGLTIVEKQNIFAKVDPQVEWFNKRKDSYSQTDPLENLIDKSKEEDSKYTNETILVIYYTLSYINLGEVVNLKNNHVVLYKTLKDEANNLVSLGRADLNLFNRWFTDIDGELKQIEDIEKETKLEADKILDSSEYRRDGSYEDALEALDPAKTNLLQLNSFVRELENVINSKR